MAREMKDSGIEWIGEIPKDWGTIKIKYTSWLKGRIGWQGLTASEYVDEGPFLVTGTDFNGGTINWSSCAHITEERFEEDSDIHIVEGDLLITKDGTVGKVAIAKKCPEKVSLNSGVLLIRNVGKYKYFDKYLYYVLCSDEFWRWYTLSQTGQSTIKHLYQAQFYEFEFSYPSLAEQIDIADYLDSECSRIDSVIEQTRASIEEYKKLKQAVITQAVTKGIRPDRQMKDSGVEWIGQIPNDWEVLSLGTVTESMRNGYVGPTKDLFYDDGIRYIQSLHIKDGRIDFSRHEYYVSEEWANSHPKIKENDVLIVQTGDIGNVGLVTKDFDGCNCHALIIATPKTDIINPEFLTYYLRSSVGKELLLYHKTGALLPHLNSGKIKFADICVASLTEQKEITEYLDIKVDEIDNLIVKKESLLTNLESYKKSLIYEYVTGKKEAPVC